MSERHPVLGAVQDFEGPLLHAIALAEAVTALGTPMLPASAEAVHAVGHATLDALEALRERWEDVLDVMGGQA